MKRLLLIGGGHAHVHVLAALAASPLPAVQVTLLSPYARQIYSGMLPGWIAGHYALEQCAIDIERLAQRAGVHFVQTACAELDLEMKQVRCADGESVSFDWLSINCGATVCVDTIPGAAAHALPIRPLEQFVGAWPALLARARHSEGLFRVAVVGDGAAGCELAFALQARFVAEKLAHVSVTLVGAHAVPLAGFPEPLRRNAAALLCRKGVVCLTQRRVLEALPGQLRLSDETLLAAEASLIVTGAAAPAWPAASGLATDAAGFIRVTRTLQSVSHPFVLAAGDIAAYADPRPKSGVFAVRAGPVLARNLRAALGGQTLQAWEAQRQALYLIGTGERHALACRGALRAGGRWVWRWKDWIDRRFIRRFNGTP